MSKNLYIIEGFDRVGKSTLLQYLTKFKTIKPYVTEEDKGNYEKEMPNYRKNPSEFVVWLKKHLQKQVEDLKELSKTYDDIVMARFFISDDVYSSLFSRPFTARLFREDVSNIFVKIHHIVLLWKSYEDYVDRCVLTSSENEYTKKEFDIINDMYRSAAKHYESLGDEVQIIEVGKDLSTKDLAKECIDIQKLKINSMFSLFWDLKENEDLADVKKYLLNRKNLDKGIIIAGVGKNFYIAEKIYKTFISMGIKCQALDCVHALHGDLGMVDGQLIFFLSKSGNTEEMVTIAKTLNMLRSKGVKKFVSCGFFLNNLPKYNDYDWMIVPSEEFSTNDIYEFDSRDLVPSLSINIMQMILDDLGIEIFESNKDLYDGYKYNHMGGSNGKKLGTDKELEEIKTSKS